MPRPRRGCISLTRCWGTFDFRPSCVPLEMCVCVRLFRTANEFRINMFPNWQLRNARAPAQTTSARRGLPEQSMRAARMENMFSKTPSPGTTFIDVQLCQVISRGDWEFEQCVCACAHFCEIFRLLKDFLYNIQRRTLAFSVLNTTHPPTPHACTISESESVFKQFIMNGNSFTTTDHRRRCWVWVCGTHTPSEK